MKGRDMPKPLIITQDDRNKALNVGGFLITVLASEHETGDYEIFHQSGSEGKGPGPHFHPWDESFFITKGELHCGVGDMKTTALPGTFIHIPGGSVHWFRFGKVGAEFISITSKGNASKMFTAFSNGITWENPDREKLIELAASYGQTIVKLKNKC